MEIRLPDEQAGEVDSSNQMIEESSKRTKAKHESTINIINNQYENRLEVVDRVPQTLPRV